MLQQGGLEVLQIFEPQLGLTDASRQGDVGPPEQILKGAHVLDQGLAFEIIGVGLDGVVKGGCQVSGGNDTRRAQIFGQDGGGRSVGRADVGVQRPAFGVRMVIDHDLRA